MRSKPATRPHPSAWDKEGFAALCGLALLLSGLTYDHSAFEVRVGGIWLVATLASCLVTFTRYRRRMREWHEEA